MRRAARHDANSTQIQMALNKAGVFVFSLEGIGGGAPDLMCLRAGRVVLVEVKTKDGRLRPGQASFASVWRACGGEWHLVRSVDEALEIFSVRTAPHAPAQASTDRK